MDYLPDTMSAMTPNFALDAKVADHKANPSYGKYTIMGALLGLIACAGVLIAGYRWTRRSTHPRIWRNILILFH